MSKTVILFTTYYITPVKEDCVFNEKSVKTHILTGQRIREVFWNMLKDDSDYLQNHLVRSISNPEEITIVPVDSRLNNPEVTRLLEKYSINPESNKDWPNAIQLKMLSDPEEAQNVLSVGEILNVVMEKPRVSLQEKDPSWLIDNLSGDQLPFAIYNSSSFPHGPWLRNRFSYYELASCDRPDTSIYAIWAVQPSVDQTEWIDALTEQVIELNNDVDEVFLILHNKDIGDSTFHVIESANNISSGSKNIRRTVAVFAHVDEIGRLLAKEDASATSIYKFLCDKCLGREILLSIAQKITLGDFLAASSDIDILKTIKPSFYESLSSKMKSINSEESKDKKATLLYDMIYDVNRMIGEFDSIPVQSTNNQ